MRVPQIRRQASSNSATCGPFVNAFESISSAMSARISSFSPRGTAQIEERHRPRAGAITGSDSSAQTTAVARPPSMGGSPAAGSGRRESPGVGVRQLAERPGRSLQPRPESVLSDLVWNRRLLAPIVVQAVGWTKRPPATGERCGDIETAMPRRRKRDEVPATRDSRGFRADGAVALALPDSLPELRGCRSAAGKRARAGLVDPSPPAPRGRARAEPRVRDRPVSRSRPEANARTRSRRDWRCCSSRSRCRSGSSWRSSPVSTTTTSQRADHSTVDDFVGVFAVITVGAWLFSRVRRADRHARRRTLRG